MQNRLTNGLLVGLAAIATGGLATVLLPQTSPLGLVGSGLGAAASSVALAKREEQILAKSSRQTPSKRPSQVANKPKASAAPFVSATALESVDQRQKTSPKMATPGRLSDAEEISNLVIEESPGAVADFRQNIKTLITWLADRDITLEDNGAKDTAIDKIFVKHAIYLGNNLKDNQSQPLLAPLLKQIKWTIANNRGLQYRLKNAS